MTLDRTESVCTVPFDTTCAACGLSMPAGTPITQDARGWIHLTICDYEGDTA